MTGISKELNSSALPKGVSWQLTAAIDRLADLPEKVEAVISERVNRLEKTLREILEAASVQGDEFIAQVIASVRQIEEWQLIDDLTGQLLHIHQLIWDRGGKSLSNGSRVHEFAFKHNLIREYVYNQLPKTKRELLHTRIGDCLECLYAPNTDEIAAALAGHFYHGHVPAKAVVYCLKAAQDANNRYGAAEALRFAKMGLEALEERAKMISQQQYAETKVRLLLELAEAEGFGGDQHEDKDHIQAGITCLEEHLSLLYIVPEELHAKVYVQLGKLCDRTNKRTQQEAKEYFEQALAIYEHHNDQKNVADILYRLGDVYPFVVAEKGEKSPDEKAIEALKRCLSIAEHLQEYKLQILCLSRLAGRYSYSYSEDFLLASQYAQQAFELSQIPGRADNYTEIKALNIMAVICRRQAKHKIGAHYLEQSLKLAKQIGDITLEVEAINDLLVHYGHYTTLQQKTQQVMEEGLLIRERVGLRKSGALSGLGYVCLIQGKWKDAEKYYHNAIIDAMTMEINQALYRRRLGELYFLQGDYVRSNTEFLLIFEIYSRFRRPLNLYPIDFVFTALNYALTGNGTKCREYLEQGQAFFERESRPRWRWEYLYHAAEVYRILRELDTAKTACQQSLDWFLTNAEDPEELIDVAEARLIMGKILVDMRAYQDALDYLAKAKTAFEICQHYALGETLLYLGKAYQGLGGAMFWRQAKEHILKALAEFQRLELHHKECEAQEVLKTL